VGFGAPRVRAGAFWLLLSAAAISTIGDGMSAAAAPLLALRLTDDARLVAGLGTAQMLPWLLLSLFSGALVDRLDRRRLMWVVDSCRAATMAIVALLVATHTARLPLLYLLFFLLGTGETLFNNASVALLPEIVPADALERANGRLQATETLMVSFVGPAAMGTIPIGGILGGLLVRAHGPASTYIVSAITLAALAVWAFAGGLPRRLLAADCGGDEPSPAGAALSGQES
jgi:MFS family permease